MLHRLAFRQVTYLGHLHLAANLIYYRIHAQLGLGSLTNVCLFHLSTISEDANIFVCVRDFNLSLTVMSKE